MIMSFGFGFDVVNVGNKLQISVSKGVKTGDRLKREGDQELIQNSNGDDNIIISTIVIVIRVTADLSCLTFPT